jgi:hypothetical protein
MWNEERGDGCGVESDGCCCCEASESCTDADRSYSVEVVLVFVKRDDVLSSKGWLDVGWNVVV